MEYIVNMMQILSRIFSFSSCSASRVLSASVLLFIRMFLISAEIRLHEMLVILYDIYVDIEAVALAFRLSRV
jgi:hypothetical protein